MNHNRDAILEALAAIGLSTNEAKAYLALLRSGPLNGNELARAAEVPSPKIYSVLERLQRKGLVMPTDRTPTTYIPIEPKHLIEMYRSTITTTLDFLDETLPQIGGVEQEVYAWQVEGHERIIERAEQLMRNAEQQILALLWDAEAILLEPTLRAAVERGVQVISVKFGDASPDVGIVYHHGLAPEVLSVEGSGLVVVVDGIHSLIAHRQSDWHGVWSSNPALVYLTRNYIYHEMYLWKIHGQLGGELYRIFGPRLERLINPEAQSDGQVVDGDDVPMWPPLPNPITSR